jgi:hypothetical protein
LQIQHFRHFFPHNHSNIAAFSFYVGMKNGGALLHRRPFTWGDYFTEGITSFRYAAAAIDRCDIRLFDTCRLGATIGFDRGKAIP